MGHTSPRPSSPECWSEADFSISPLKWSADVLISILLSRLRSQFRALHLNGDVNLDTGIRNSWYVAVPLTWLKMSSYTLIVEGPEYEMQYRCVVNQSLHLVIENSIPRYNRDFGRTAYCNIISALIGDMYIMVAYQNDIRDGSQTFEKSRINLKFMIEFEAIRT